MAEPLTRRLTVWDGELPAPAGAARPPADDDGPRRLFAAEAFTPGRCRTSAEPFSPGWFRDLEAARYARHGAWLPRLLEFGKHAREVVLGLGDGLGTDWVQYARHGADVVACSPSPALLGVVQRNFEAHGLSARFLAAAPAGLPLATASVDVVCLTSLLAADAPPRAVAEEVYRVLRPGGKVLAVARAKYDVDFWCRDWLPWAAWLRSSVPLPAESATAFSARSLRRLFARFDDHRTHKRHLRRSDLPHVYRWLPLGLLERLCGRVLVLKAFKPISAALAPTLAA
jgi:SAM-dependent methyltransferase